MLPSEDSDDQADQLRIGKLSIFFNVRIQTIPLINFFIVKHEIPPRYSVGLFMTQTGNLYLSF